MILSSKLLSHDVVRFGILSVAILSAGIVVSFLLSFPWTIAVGIAVACFLALLFLRDPFSFLLVMMPLRMILDFSGEFVSIRVTETLLVSLSQAVGIFLSGICFSYILLSQKARFNARKIPLMWLFLMWCGASWFISIAPAETFRDILRIFDIFALALLALTETKTMERFRLLLISLLISSVVPIIFGVFQYVTGAWYPDDYTGLERIYGTFGHPNVFGLFLFSIVAVSLLFIRSSSFSKRDRVCGAVTGLMSVVLLIATLARVAWVALIFFIFSWISIRFRRLMLPTAIVVFLSFLLVQPIQIRVFEAFTPSADSSVLWRFGIWDDALSSTLYGGRELFGSGLNTFSSVVGNMHSESFGSAEAHNDFVKFFVEGGVVGLLLYVAFLGWFIYGLYIRYRSSRGLYKDLALLLLLFFMALILASLSDAVFKSTPIQWILWVLVGAFFGLPIDKPSNSQSLQGNHLNHLRNA